MDIIDLFDWATVWTGSKIAGAGRTPEAIR